MNPTLKRWLPVLVLPPILLLDGLLSDSGGNDQDVNALGVVITYLAVLPLLWRERLGFFALAPLLVGGVVALLWSYGPGTTVVAIPAWALFELARRNGRRETIIAAVALPPCVLASLLPFHMSGAEMISTLLRNLALCELALAVGYVMWHNRTALARDRAAHDADSERRLGEERLRIAREVHDVVAHAMVAINVQSGVAAHLLDQDTEQAREALLQIKRTSGEALNDLRATLGVLRDPDQAAPVGPTAGLEDLDTVAAQLRAAGVEVTIDVAGAELVPTPVGSASYRIVQEALTNVLRHAHARRATVMVRADPETLSLVITDDGVGGPYVPPDLSEEWGGEEPPPRRRPSTNGGGSGAGVRGMRERATALGGVLAAGPAEGGGWRVEAALPLAPARSAS
ncbi:signal transduction histidine kinase [Solirubrobacter pauli]|uniref:histidine kinase n=1 Tax=Solirubrobacter pauli TaxID=166793 RepID=A0A660LAM9_9ACTN|nr:sensor histidine kinase [Solirubrobacter pauli]RKQ92117.1 signal transduction histidine kinase [Solirubrobacter pauli]